MNKQNWEDLQEYLPLLADLNLDFSFLYLTKTSYEKSTIDATIPFRNFLKRNNLHDFDSQKDGPENKIFLPTLILLNDKIFETKSSLYRPNHRKNSKKKDKRGDPRIWFYGFTKHYKTSPYVAVTTNGKQLIVINLSDELVRESLSSNGNIYKYLKYLNKEKNKNAKELYEKIKLIYEKGFIPTVVSGDTGVGMTLEHELGIKPNSSSKPDYKGIELKASRKKKQIQNTIINRAPNWENSTCKNTKEIIEKYGYYKEEKHREQLNTTIYFKRANPRGLYSEIVEKESKLLIKHSEDGKVIEWNLEELKKGILEKHRETFWVEAESKFIDGIEHFRYFKIVHTKEPNISVLDSLISNNIITIDMNMHIKPNGTAHWRSFALRISKSNRNKFFPKQREFDLRVTLDNF